MTDNSINRGLWSTADNHVYNNDDNYDGGFADNDVPPLYAYVNGQLVPVVNYEPNFGGGENYNGGTGNADDFQYQTRNFNGANGNLNRYNYGGGDDSSLQFGNRQSSNQQFGGSSSDSAYYPPLGVMLPPDGSDYTVDGDGTVDGQLIDQPDDTDRVVGREATETTNVTQPFSQQNIDDGIAFVERMKHAETNPLSDADASYLYGDEDSLGQLGRIVGSPDPETGEFAAGAEFRAGEVFITGVVESVDPETGESVPVGTAGGTADEQLAMELQEGNISTTDFITLANDEVFLSRNGAAREDYIRERYTDQGIDNIANGRDPTNGEDNIYTSRDGLLFKVPDAAGNPDEGPVEPYFVRADGSAIPSNLQGRADTEGLGGGLSPHTQAGIAVLGGTMELTPEQQAVADSVVNDYLVQSGAATTDDERQAATDTFLQRVQGEVLGEEGYANVTVEGTVPETVTPFISDNWRAGLTEQHVDGPNGLRAESQFIEPDGTITDLDGLWGEIQERVDTPQAQQFVYESLTGSLYDANPSAFPVQPVTINGETIPAERVEFLDIVAEDAVFQMADREDLDEAGVTQKLQASVEEGGLTQVEADYVEGRIDELQAGTDSDRSATRTGSWEQGATPWLSAEQKEGHATDIIRLARIDPNDVPPGVDPDDAYRVAIDSSFPDASPQLKNFLHSEVTGEPYFEDQIALRYDRSAAVSFGLDPLNYGEQQEAEAVIAEGLDILEKNPDMDPWEGLDPALQQSVDSGELTPQQADFIMSVLGSRGYFPMNNDISFSGM